MQTKSKYLLLATAKLIIAQDICDNATEKSECGFFGIDQFGCEDIGCCWRESNVFGEPWCFQRPAEIETETLDPSCVLSDAFKFDCGFVGVNEFSCQEQGCCWQESDVQGVPWCFFSDTNFEDSTDSSDESELGSGSEESSTNLCNNQANPTSIIEIIVEDTLNSTETPESENTNNFFNFCQVDQKIDCGILGDDQFTCSPCIRIRKFELKLEFEFESGTVNRYKNL